MRRLLPLALALLVLPACRPEKLAGESVGQFRVEGELIESTCGAGHAVPQTLLFHVELRDEPGPVGYWKLADGPIANGTVEAGAFRFEGSTEHVGLERTDAHPGCTLIRREVIAGELVQPSASGDAGDAPDGGTSEDDARDGFDGTTTVTISPATGSECSALLLPQGGAFPALPCELSFDLRGTRLEEPLW